MSTTGITGRDDSIIIKALAYAIVAIERRPDKYQEWSDKEDMRKLLKHFCPDQAERDMRLESAKQHLTGIGWSPDEPISGPVVKFPGSD